MIVGLHRIVRLLCLLHTTSTNARRATSQLLLAFQVYLYLCCNDVHSHPHNSSSFLSVIQTNDCNDSH